MPIVSTRYKEFPQADGTKRVHVYFTDHNGEEKRRSMHDVPDTQDTAQWIIDNTAQINLDMLDDERLNIENYVFEGNSPDDYVKKHLTNRQAVRPIIKGFMRMKASIKSVVIAEWLSATINDAMFTSEIDAATLLRIKSRITGLIVAKTTLIEDAAKEEEII